MLRKQEYDNAVQLYQAACFSEAIEIIDRIKLKINDTEGAVELKIECQNQDKRRNELIEILNTPFKNISLNTAIRKN